MYRTGGREGYSDPLGKGRDLENAFTEKSLEGIPRRARFSGHCAPPWDIPGVEGGAYILYIYIL